MRFGRTSLALLCGLLVAAATASRAEPVSFAAADGVAVFADYTPAKVSGDKLVLLFHQAGSNRGEYATIAPALAALGYATLAVDQRSGGNLWGRQNETVQHLGHSADYGAARLDLEAALAWARANGHAQKVILWGSSYSASLVFLVAAKHPQEIAAVLAFSPGEYFSDPGSVRHAAAQLTLPIFATSAKESDEIAAAKAILAAAPSKTKTQFIPQVAGVHGSSTLRTDRNPKGAEENWAAAKAFLAALPQ
jgi:dienelactone hydrolase